MRTTRFRSRATIGDIQPHPFHRQARRGCTLAASQAFKRALSSNGADVFHLRRAPWLVAAFGKGGRCFMAASPARGSRGSLESVRRYGQATADTRPRHDARSSVTLTSIAIGTPPYVGSDGGMGLRVMVKVRRSGTPAPGGAQSNSR